MMYKVSFKHTWYNGTYSHKHIDWTLVEADNEIDAGKEAKAWVKENRSRAGHCNRVTILETKKLA